MSDHARSALKQRGISGHTATVMITEAELQGGDPLDPDFWCRWSDMELMRVPGLGKHALREIRQFAPLPSVTPTMIERVARAFAGLHIVTASGSVVRHTDLAHAAIEAMREPTEAMIRAGEDEPTGPRAYRAMIRAALGDAT